ncbi:MAG: hypothetical protein ACOZBL_00260 [Patescibacteria group bacterium]
MSAVASACTQELPADNAISPHHHLQFADGAKFNFQKLFAADFLIS